MLCKDCINKKCLKLGKPCKEVEQELRKNKIYGSQYIRPELSSKGDRDTHGRLREIPYSNLRKEDKKRIEWKLGTGYWSK